MPAATAGPESGCTVSTLLMVQVKPALTGGVLLSVTVTMGEYVPGDVGVPEIRPEAGAGQRDA